MDTTPHSTSVDPTLSRFAVSELSPDQRVRREEAERRMLDVLPKLERAAPTMLERLTLPALLLLAWFLFELTASATLSLLVACLKFGWDDFRTALWIRRTDPNHLRGRACCWFYAASGVWKTALTPLLVLMVVSVTWAVAAPNAQEMDRAIAWQAASAIGVGVAASALLVVIVALAIVWSIVAEVRVWVHHELHESRRSELWPPQFRSQSCPHDNRGRAILATALLFVTIGLPPVLFPAVVMLGPKMETTAALALVFGVPIVATTLYGALRGRIFAYHPGQCWPEAKIDNW